VSSTSYIRLDYGSQKCRIINLRCLRVSCRKGRYEVDGYVYNKNEEPKIMITGKWNESLSCQPCDVEGEPIEGTELKEVSDPFLCLELHLFFDDYPL
jgi:hypothetical protein